MGTAHKFSKGHKTTTIIGTPHYMAPEVMAGKGHSYYVDLWSLGVMLYEFLAGAVPFAEECDDPYEIYESIMHNSISYPSFFTDKNAKSMVE
jgi:cGMP-dependent protein kinase 1